MARWIGRGLPCCRTTGGRWCKCFILLFSTRAPWMITSRPRQSPRTRTSKFYIFAALGTLGICAMVLRQSTSPHTLWATSGTLHPVYYTANSVATIKLGSTCWARTPPPPASATQTSRILTPRPSLVMIFSSVYMMLPCTASSTETYTYATCRQYVMTGSCWVSPKSSPVTLL